VTFSITVGSEGGPVPTGTVYLFDGTGVLAILGLTNGTASFTDSSLSPRPHNLHATYTADQYSYFSRSPYLRQVVERAPTTTSLSSSPNPSQHGQAVTFTAQVTSSGAMPTGGVRFLDGTTTIGRSKLSGGVATLTTAKLKVGTHPITAEYEGDRDNDPSTSPVLYQVVQ